MNDGGFSVAQQETLPYEECRSHPTIYEKYFKRMFDLIAGIALFVLLSPFMLVIFVLVKIDSPGPAVYKQERLGLKGKPFMIYKFRSMRIDAECEGPTWALKEDARATRFGRFIRTYHIDELPQLYNIIRGEMSFVGPRPERAYFYNIFEKRVPGFHTRLAVKPGLTGWAQINGGYDISPEDKLKFDKEYIANINPITDAYIILKTFKAVIKGAGAR